MSSYNKISLLSAVALTASMSLSHVGQAFASQATSILSQAHSTGKTATPAYYSYQGHHYAYRNDGKYYNHRSHKDGHWSYY